MKRNWQSLSNTASSAAARLLDRHRIRTLTDRFTRAVIIGGGIAIILAILGMCAFLVKEVFPLFQSPEATPTRPIALTPASGTRPSAVIAGIDEHQEIAYVVRGESLEFVSVNNKPLPQPAPAPQALTAAGSVTAVARTVGKEHRLALGTNGGQVIPVSVEFVQQFSGETRSITPSVTTGEPVAVDPTSRPIRSLAYQTTESGTRIAAVSEDQRLWFVGSRTVSRPDGTADTSVTQAELTSHFSGRITALTFDSRGDTLFVGTDEGKVRQFDLRDVAQPVPAGTFLAFEKGEAVTALASLIGDRALAVGSAAGQVAVWMPVRESPDSNVIRMKPVHRFSSHAGAITGITISQRDKGFITADVTGEIRLHHSTSEQTVLQIHPQQGPVRSVYFAPKANGVVGVTDTDHVLHYHIQNPHPEITWRTLFFPVWYEGYSQPDLVWQSSSGSDDFEPKLSLTPLIFGTLKGTVFALLLAVPLAVLAAIYTAMFMHPSLRAKLKPTIEIMAALPTVVLGFLAGLWFAPVLERNVPAIAAMVIVLPLTIVGCALLFLALPTSVRRRIRPGAEALLMVPVIIGVAWGCIEANGWWESTLFGTPYKVWLETHLGLRYDQRNALVVGAAMGFAIIPIIYSISEEALSNVPKNLIAGSLALGATRWQTLAHLVLISASPGIFSALMIGLGRAVGETMIVLMATGNTPIMEWSPFNGFRTLSANIAVEIPEAPHGGTLYRTLFLAGLLLFLVTFVINTGAELVRQRLRAKYSQF